MRGRTPGGDAGNQGDTGRACLSPGPGHAQAERVEGGAGTNTKLTAPIPALCVPASRPRAEAPGDSSNLLIPPPRELGIVLNSRLENPEDP